MTRTRRPVAPDDRGQTLQDYVVGISIFIVVVFMALAFFPNLLSGFQTGTVADHEAQADRVAREIVTNASTSGSINDLNATIIEEIVAMSEDDLRSRYGLHGSINLNITVESLDGGSYVTDGTTTLAGEPGYFGDSAGTAARIVTLTDKAYGCSPACRLVVRAW